MITPTLEYERTLWSQGLTHIAGVDEVGRGALAGPVVTAAVIFSSEHTPIQGVRDSKTLSKKQKETLYQLIVSEAIFIGIGEASPQEIDTLGIVPATGLAMQRALEQCSTVSTILVDGLPFKDASILSSYQKQFIVKGDAFCYSIAAASIVAKVYRDELMKRVSLEHSRYAFEKNVGYGTTAHREAITRFGLSDQHRLSFCGKLVH